VVGDHSTGHDRLARSRRRDEHAEVVVDEIRDRGRLLESERPPELEVRGGWFGAVV
jgi:hypothetical protein